MEIEVSKNNISLGDYQQLFRLHGNVIPYLLSDLFFGYYKNLDCLLISEKGTWTSYIPKIVVEKTLKDGLDLFSDSEAFLCYSKDFNEYIEKTINLLNALLEKNNVTRDGIEEAFTIVSGIWKYYSKTEFFYTDKVYMQLEEKPSKVLITNIELFEDIKTKGREFLNQIVFNGGYMEKLVVKISNQFSLNASDVMQYRIDEVLELFKGRFVDPNTLKDRTMAFIQIAFDGKLSCIYGSDAVAFIERSKSTPSNLRGDVRGIVANKGNVTGIIKVIPSNYYADFKVLKKTIDEMNQGDILVAETTSPELMPACKKAGAIITNQGGLLSHAAIVSRELNIPCIVGIGDATEIFKNGDFVEVDANNGIVKII